ncbi:MAG: Asp-tRNAAsn/Glu-tRNAGln amidotransferase A subunit or related amidase [Candidatus Alkanophagales archaeon MCA70_species_1]|nr:Asp-tRNAAsn/Glu-tRNAGln amidotransferase A subunit or related amidase [Candidatus Alkanophaga volatiphilum]
MKERFSGYELVESIRGGEVSSEELVLELLERIERSDLNCYITVCGDAALEAARRADRAVRENDRKALRKRLLGVPVAVKDCISTKGIQTTCASKILCGYVPPFDATVVRALKDEGAVILGKTNMDEFCMGSTTETSYFGPTRNPHDKSRVPGGSSGGSAAAVAAGETVLALGTDTGGSIRCPAAFCGVVGLKPTYGLVSRYGLIAYANSLEQIGPITQSVLDAALLLDVIAVEDPKDATQVKGVRRSFFEELRTLAASWEKEGVAKLKLRVGVPREFVEGVDTGVEKAFWAAVERLKELGADVGEISFRSMRFALAAYYVIAMSEASSNLARYDGLRYGLRLEKDEDWHTTFSKIRGKGFGEEVKRRIILGTFALSAGYYGRYYLKALKVRTLVRHDFDEAFKRFDVLATPTMPFVAFKLGERIKDPLSLYLADVNTVPINLAGVPSISVPCGLSDGLPVGLQLIGRHFDEATLLKAALAFEMAWKD